MELPTTLLARATKAVPATKYAVGVAGLAAAVAVIASFKLGPWVAVVGVILMLGLMFGLLAFSAVASAKTGVIRGPAVMLLWGFSLLILAAAILTLTVSFFGWPREWASIVGRTRAAPGSIVESDSSGASGGEVPPLRSAPTDTHPVRSDSSPSVPTVDTIERSFQVDDTNDHHRAFESNVQAYRHEFEADSGYRIVSFEFEKRSATRESGLVINSLRGGSSIEISFSLKAGPSTDRYRGWLRGVLHTKQERIQP